MSAACRQLRTLGEFRIRNRLLAVGDPWDNNLRG
jgi:hypothetical protein